MLSRDVSLEKALSANKCFLNSYTFTIYSFACTFLFKMLSIIQLLNAYVQNYFLVTRACHSRTQKAGEESLSQV